MSVPFRFLTSWFRFHAYVLSVLGCLAEGEGEEEGYGDLVCLNSLIFSTIHFFFLGNHWEKDWGLGALSAVRRWILSLTTGWPASIMMASWTRWRSKKPVCLQPGVSQEWGSSKPFTCHIFEPSELCNATMGPNSGFWNFGCWRVWSCAHDKTNSDCWSHATSMGLAFGR